MGNRVRQRICFAQAFPNTGRYQQWLLAASNQPIRYAVRYNDFYPCRQKLLGGTVNLAYKICSRIIRSLRSIPSILWADVVVFCNMNVDMILYCIARLFRKKVLLDVYISNYQTLVLSRKTINEKTLRAELCYRLEQFRFNTADRLIFLTEEEKKYYVALLDASPKGIDVIPLGNQAKPRADLPFFRGTTARPSICWWGGENNPIHGLGTIIKGLKLLESKGVDFDFTILGYDPTAGKTYYRDLLNEVGWKDKVQIHYYASDYDKFCTFLKKKCDIGFGLISLEKKAISVVANKSLDCLHMGIPLVTIDSAEMRRFWDDSQVYYCPEPSPEAVCECVEKVLSDSSVIDKVERARSVFDQTRSLYILGKQFLSVLDGLSHN